MSAKQQQFPHPLVHKTLIDYKASPYITIQFEVEWKTEQYQKFVVSLVRVVKYNNTGTTPFSFTQLTQDLFDSIYSRLQLIEAPCAICRKQSLIK